MEDEERKHFVERQVIVPEISAQSVEKGEALPVSTLMKTVEKMVTVERCHQCHKDMKIVLDLGLEGNHVIECPHCGHEHCRVVEGGKVTGFRWDVRQQSWYTAGNYYNASVTMYTGTGCSSSDTFCMGLWTDSTSGS